MRKKVSYKMEHSDLILVRYLYWLDVVARIYGVDKSYIGVPSRVHRKEVTAARAMIYCLCIRDGITLSKLGVIIGYTRSALRDFFDFNDKKDFINVNGYLINEVYRLYG